jgi:hypothetical protein
MTVLRIMLAGCAIAAAAFTIEAAAAATLPAKTDTGHAVEFSAAKRATHYRHDRHVRRYQAPHYSTYRRGNDPSLAPNGGPYRVPAYLRNQCHIDEGYGRFSACPNE